MTILVFIVILWNYPSLMTYRILFPAIYLDKSKISRFKDILKQKYNIITQWRYLVNIQGYRVL